jgi:hypothetical protein
LLSPADSDTTSTVWVLNSKSSKRSFLSDGDCDDRGDLQGIEVTGYYLDVNRKKSVLRHLLHSQDNLCEKNEPLSFLSSMDIPKSRYGRHSFQNSDEEYNMINLWLIYIFPVSKSIR